MTTRPTSYQQNNVAPSVLEYCELRRVCGLSPKTIEAAERGLPNSLYATTIRDQGKLIAMGRVVGDRGCNYEVVDIAVHPDYQRQGLGQQIMAAIMSFIEADAPESAYVSLIADHHSPALYSKFGFEPTAPVSIGMAFKVDR
ncbi:MAG: GNAT family N-acetyltransferase [Pseudomonadota bacterium]